MKELIVFYSRRGQNLVNGEVKTLTKGNTEVVADYLRFLTGAELFQIRQEVDYPEDYYRCIDLARQDLYRGVRPNLRSWPDGIEDYDTIYLGYPNYWGTMPMAVYSFLEQLNFAGKVIRPFCTHDGGGLGRSVEELRRICPEAHVTEGFSIRGSDIKRKLAKARQWLTEESQGSYLSPHWTFERSSCT